VLASYLEPGELYNLNLLPGSQPDLTVHAQHQHSFAMLVGLHCRFVQGGRQHFNLATGCCTARRRRTQQAL
jgi:hypothetical protein